MVSREEIALFYDRYKKNLDKEEKLLETVGSVENEKVWLETLSNRKMILKELYKDNMELLNKYLYPYLFNNEELTPDIAQAFLDEATEFYLEGYTDVAASVEIIRMLAEYYEKQKNDAKFIEATHTISALCIDHATFSSLKHGLDSCKEEMAYLDRYFEFEEYKTRRSIVASVFNYVVALCNMTLFIDKNDVEMAEWIQVELSVYTKMVEEVYRDPKIRELDGNAVDFDGRLDILHYEVCGNILSNIGLKFPFDKELLDYVTSKIEEYYYKSLDLHSENTPEDVYFSFLIAQYMREKIEYNDFVEKYYNAAKNIIIRDKDKYKDNFDGELMMTSYFRCCTYNLPFFIQYLKKDETDKVLYNEIINTCIESFLDLLDWVPHSKNFSRMSTVIVRGGIEIIKYLPSKFSPFHFVIKVILNRDESAVIRSAMVRRISNIILNYIYRNKAEILLGVFGIDNVIEILSRQEEITDYLNLSSHIFDIGKIQNADIFRKETRDLMPLEEDIILSHPLEGYNIIKGVEALEVFKDVILGHHKYYNGNGGYPAFIDNTQTKNKIIVDLISICDFIVEKTAVMTIEGIEDMDGVFSELRKGQGSKYNPDIVGCILSSPKLKDELNKACITERARLLYDIYYENFYTKPKVAPVEEMNFTGFAKNAQNSMHNFIIDMMEDTIDSTYFGSNSVISSRVTGSFKKFLASQFAKMVHEDDKARLKILLDYGGLGDKFSAGNGSFEIEVRILVKNEWRWHRLHFVVIEEQHGIPKKMIVAMDDINEECKRRLQIVHALENAKEEAKLANSAKTMFISNISHEIRTPMNAIVGMVEIMLREEMPANQRGYLMNIRNSGNALLSIINDILDFSKMESGRLEIIEDEYEMMSLLNDLGMIFLNRIGEKPVELIFDIDNKIPELLYGDVGRIRQIIINIMNNAIKFTDQGYVKLKMVIHEMDRNKIQIAVSIKDTGIGIKEEEIPKLFGAFQQVDIKRNRSMEGTGLGLAISKQLIELMGGNISVESEYGKGTEFFFTIEQQVVSKKYAVDVNLSDEDKEKFVVGSLYDNNLITDSIKILCKEFKLQHVDLNNTETNDVNLVFTDGVNYRKVKNRFSDTDVKICISQNPMMESIKEENARIVNKPLYTVNFCHIINNEEDKVTSVKTEQYLDFMAPEAKILVVDDTEMNLTVVKGLLQPLKLQIDTAENGKVAIDMIQKKHYDLVFMDHKMPVMDGVEATELIRKIEGSYYQEVPIIALTANAVLDARESFIKAGMNDFVAKPIEMKNICSKIKKWLPKELILKRDANEVQKNNIDRMSMPAIKGIDIQEGVKNSGSFELFGTLIHDYYKLIDTKTEKINRLLEEKDIKNYTIEVHALKSTSRMIGALKLSEKFKQLEAWGDNNEVDNIYEETPKVIKEFVAYKSHLKDFVEQWEIENSSSEKQEVSNQELIDILESIISATQSCDLDMMDECMHQLEKCSTPESVKSQMDKLLIATADFAMEDIVSLSNEIITELKK